MPHAQASQHRGAGGETKPKAKEFSGSNDLLGQIRAKYFIYMTGYEFLTRAMYSRCEFNPGQFDNRDNRLNCVEETSECSGRKQRPWVIMGMRFGHGIPWHVDNWIIVWDGPALKLGAFWNHHCPPAVPGKLNGWAWDAGWPKTKQN